MNFVFSAMSFYTLEVPAFWINISTSHLLLQYLALTTRRPEALGLISNLQPNFIKNTTIACLADLTLIPPYSMGFGRVSHEIRWTPNILYSFAYPEKFSCLLINVIANYVGNLGCNVDQLLNGPFIVYTTKYNHVHIIISMHDKLRIFFKGDMALCY